MQDLSFIRLEPTFPSAKYTRTSPLASIFFFGQICLSPNETYLQTTNTKDGIAFDGNYNVFVVDCEGTQLKDITNNVAINERTINGKPQIDFEIVNIGSDYYSKQVYLKFVHTVSNYVWFSNPLNITDAFIKNTSRFDYKNATDAYYQSIRLKVFFTVNDAESQSNEYVTYNGKKLTSRLINTELEKYVFEKIDNFTYRRLNNLLSRNIVYINGNRITDKQTLQSNDLVGDTNVYNIDFKVAIDYNETYDYTLQIFIPLELISKMPNGLISSTPVEITGIFNQTIVKNTGTIKLYKDNILIKTFIESDIVMASEAFTVSLTGLSITNADYYVTISSGLFSNSISVFNGIDNATDWAFTKSDGEFSLTDFNNEFLIN